MKHVDISERPAFEAAELQALNNEAASLVERETKTTYAMSYGEAYTQGMPRKECAEHIRKALRRLAKSKHSPLSGADISVRTRSYSGGGAIDITVKVDWQVREDDEQREMVNRSNGKRWPWLTDRARSALLIAQGLHDAYNFDCSDILTDYFHVNYCGSADIRQNGSAW